MYYQKIGQIKTYILIEKESITELAELWEAINLLQTSASSCRSGASGLQDNTYIYNPGYISSDTKDPSIVKLGYGNWFFFS